MSIINAAMSACSWSMRLDHSRVCPAMMCGGCRPTSMQHPCAERFVIRWQVSGELEAGFTAALCRLTILLAMIPLLLGRRSLLSCNARHAG